jgi:hypothetical protein
MAFKMKNKRILVLGFTLVLLTLAIGIAFAQQSNNPWRGTGQIINADTFEVITTFDLKTAGGIATEASAKTDIRLQLGFPRSSDERTANGVTQRIIWISLARE